VIRRVIAAVAAIVLAVVGFILVINYASDADERALEGMQTDDVLVAVNTIPQGTSAEDLIELVEVRAVPQRFQVTGPVADLDDLADQVAVADIAAGEQLQAARFATRDQLRGLGEFELPDGAQDLHQVTVPLTTARALGGNVAPGDLVGVFVSIDATFNSDLFVDENGNVQFSDEGPEATEGDEQATGASGDVSLSLTKLILEKVLVTQVQGGFVPSSAPTDEDGDDQSDDGPEDEIQVTLALSGSQAEQLVYAMEFGNVWLSYEPETAEEDEDDVKVVQLPDTVGDVLE
jgi:pilus assembly protein CpaB